jgi:hypothetical protein
MKEEILSTALTAITTGKPVWVVLSSFTPYSLIDRFYVRG